MALLIYPADNAVPALQGLLDPELRQQVASLVNEAILERKGLERQARLRGLVRLRAWSERKGRERGVGGLGGREDVPGLELWGRAEGQNDARNENGNEGEDSVMGGDGAGLTGEAMAT